MTSLTESLNGSITQSLNHSMLTLFILLWPAAAALLVALVGDGAAKRVALGAALVELAAVLVLAAGFVPDASTQFAVDVPWIADAGIHFHVGYDGISLLLVLLTVVLVPLIVLTAWGTEFRTPRAFYALVLLMQTGLLGVFTSRDAFLFYFFWEVALIPVYFLSAIWGGERRARVTFKFFVYTVFGSLFMLAAFLYLYFAQAPGARSADVQALYDVGRTLPESVQSILFWFIFLAFAIKMPVVPFHTWQPDTYTESPTPATMLLSGIMLKMGLYGVLRWLLPVVPAGAHEWGPVALGLGVIGIVYGALIAIRQNDIKTLFAYSSLSHVGLIAAGLFSNTVIGLTGGVLQMLAHGVNVVGLFFAADWLLRRTGTRQVSELGGVARTAPVFATLFLVIVMASAALPLTSGFVGEFLLLQGVFQFNPWLAAVAGTTIIFGAVYLLRMYQRTMLGETVPVTNGVRDLSALDLAVLVPIVVLVFWLGLYPATFLRLAEPAVAELLKQTMSTGPLLGSF